MNVIINIEMPTCFKVAAIITTLIVFNNTKNISANNHPDQLKEDSSYQKPLNVGDKIPDFKFDKLINYPNKTARISDFRGKLLILDFWSTGCAGCISSWPKLIGLQNEFQGKLQIVLVNAWEKEVIIRKTFERRKKTAGVNIPFPATIGPDSFLTKLFAISGLPYIVWIDENGYIKAFTDAGSVNSKNIQAALNRESFKMPQYIGMDEKIFPKNYALPIFANENAGNPRQIYWQSTFAQGEDRLAYGYLAYARENPGYFIYSNQSIRDQYRFAYSNRYIQYGPAVSDSSLDLLMLNRIKFLVSDTNPYVPYINGETIRNNVYVYQLIAPPSTTQKLQERMRSDLKHYIGLNARWENIKMKCLILSASDTTLLSYKEGVPRFDLVDNSLTQIVFNNVLVRYIVERLEDVIPGFNYSPYPIIDETGYKGRVGLINLEGNLNDYKAVDQALAKYKMHLTLQDRYVEILVISEPDGYYFPFEKNGDSK